MTPAAPTPTDPPRRPDASMDLLNNLRETALDPSYLAAAPTHAGRRRRGPVLLPARPQIAPGEAQEHSAAPRLHPLALQSKEQLLDRVGHAYSVGSGSPASANPLARSRQASQRPQARPSSAGS